MEKLCIVKLRKEWTPLTHCPDPFAGKAPPERTLPGHGAEATDEAKSGVQDLRDSPARTISLSLTGEQARTCLSDPVLLSLCGATNGKGIEAVPNRDEKMVLQLKLDPVAAMRLITMKEATRVLRIGKGSVNRLIRQGKLRCYRFGRLRRLSFADLLTCLETCREATDPQCRDSTPASSGRVATGEAAYQ